MFLFTLPDFIIMATGKEYKKYFIRQYSFEEYPHGGIGYTDAETILEREGFRPITFPSHNEFSAKAKLNRIFYLLTVIFSIRGPAIVVFIFPAYAVMVKLLLRVLSWKPGVRIICFIGDIDGLRDGDNKKLSKEVKLLRKWKYFIAHTAYMQQWINEKAGEKLSAVLDCWDYLAKPLSAKRKITYGIVFAGNLSKSGFIDKLYLLYNQSPLLKFNLYGPGAANSVSQQINLKYHGIHHPYELLQNITGSFGLIWDGESIDTCNGSYGEYLRYNSQHKLSSYILSSIPVIVWENAATAILVEKYKIGFAINNLYEIEEKIKNISEEEYLRMQINMQPLTEKISTGGCIKEAIANILHLIDKNNQS